MADTTTTTYGLTKPEVGASQNDWDGYVCNQAGHAARITARHGIEVLE